MPTLKSRKIFKVSKEELSKNNNSYTVSNAEQQDLPRYPPAAFIERTPRRISTVSSLQVQDNDDDIQVDSRVNGAYTNYENRDFDEKKPRHVDEGLHQRFTRRYREFQEFKFKNIFGKRTVVRKTEISMDMYADRYKEDLQVERQRKSQDRQDSIEYNFECKGSKQNSRENYTSPTASLKSNVSTPIRQLIKQEFQEPSRIKLKQVTRFRSESTESEDDEKPKVEYSQSWRFGTLRGKSINRKESVTEKRRSIRPQINKKHTIEKKNNEKLRWTFKSKHEMDGHNEKELRAETKKKWTFKKPKEKLEKTEKEQKTNRWTLRNTKAIQTNDDNTNQPPPPSKKKWTLRSSPSIDDELEGTQPDVNTKSLKRIKKKHKTRPKDLDMKDVDSNNMVQSATTKRRSWSVNKHLSSSIDSYSSAKEDSQSSSWNFKKLKGSDLLTRWKQRTMQVLSQPNLSTLGLEGSSPEKKQKITLRIWKRNRNMNKSASLEDVQQKPESKSFLNLKYFNKRANEEPMSVEEVIIDNKKLTHKERLENAKDRAKHAVNEQIQKLNFFRGQQASTNSEDAAKNPKKKTAFDEDLDDVVAAKNIKEIQNSPAAIWASEQSINSLETNDFNMNMPKVLIRQQSYENREPTLVITMTSSRLHPHISPLFRGKRLESLDSIDSDGWISNTFNNIIVEKEIVETSKGRNLNKNEKRRASIDVFQNKAPFENFENELLDTPVISIDSEIPPPPPSSSPPREEFTEEKLYEVIDISNNSRSIHQCKKLIRNSSKDQLKTSTTARPRSFRRPTVQPPNIPERTASMVNLTRPIIKQGSLRRKLSADLESKSMGIGKVNTLITQFENSLEDLTGSIKSRREEQEQASDLTKSEPVVKLKPIDVKKRILAPAVPIPSPRLTTTEFRTPFRGDPVENIPVIAPVSISPVNNNNNDSTPCNRVEKINDTNNNLQKEATTTTNVHAKEDEHYFSLSDEGEFEISF